jgi:hypothetical protein
MQGEARRRTRNFLQRYVEISKCRNLSRANAPPPRPLPVRRTAPPSLSPASAAPRRRPRCALVVAAVGLPVRRAFRSLPHEGLPVAARRPSSCVAKAFANVPRCLPRAPWAQAGSGLGGVASAVGCAGAAGGGYTRCSLPAAEMMAVCQIFRNFARFWQFACRKPTH